MSNYFEVTEESRGVLEFALNVEGDHSRTAGTLLLHHCVLRVRGQACGETAKDYRLGERHNITLQLQKWADVDTESSQQHHRWEL